MPGVRFEIDPSQAQAALQSMQADLKGLGLTTQMTEKEIKALETRLNAGMGARKGQEAVERLRQACGMSSIEIMNLHMKTKNYGGVLDEVGRKAEQFKDKLLSVKSALAALAVGVVAKDILDVGANFEHSMNIVRAVSGATAEEFKQLQAAAREVGRTTEWGAQSAANALEDLTKAGLSVKQSIQALPQVVDFATAANLALGRSAEISSNMMRMMGFEVNQMTRIMDVFLKTANLSTIDVEDMIESFTYVGPVGKMFGYTLEQMAAMIGVLGNSSIKGSMAGTQLTQAIAGTSKVAKELGLGPGVQLIDVLKEMEKQGKGADWTMKQFTDRAARAVGILKDAIPSLQEFEQNISGIQGTTADLAEIMRSDVQNSIKIFKSQLESMKLDIFERFGDSIKGAVNEMADYIRDNKDMLLDFVGSIGEMTKTLGQFSLHIAGLFGNAVTGWNTLPTVIQEIGIVGALVGGAKMKLAIIAIAELLGLGKKAIDWAMGSGQKAQTALQSSLGHTESEVKRGIQWADGKIKEYEKIIASEQEKIKNPPKSATGKMPLTEWLTNHEKAIKQAQVQLAEYRKIKQGYVTELQDIQDKTRPKKSSEELLDLGSMTLRSRINKETNSGPEIPELTDEEKQAVEKRKTVLKEAKTLLEQLANINMSDLDKSLIEAEKQFDGWKNQLLEAKAPQSEFLLLTKLQNEAFESIKTEAARTEIQRYADTMSSIMDGVSDTDPRQALMKDLNLQAEYQRKMDAIKKAGLDKAHQEELEMETSFWRERQRIINDNDTKSALIGLQVEMANEFASISEEFRKTDARYWAILEAQSEAAYQEEVTRIQGLLALIQEEIRESRLRGDSPASIAANEKRMEAYYRKLDFMAENKATGDRKRWREQIQYMGDMESTGLAAWEEFRENQESSSQMMYSMWINAFQAAEQGVSDVFFNVLIGKIHDLGDVIKSLFESIKTSIIRMIADIAAQKFVLNVGANFLQGYGGSIGQGITNQIGSSFLSSLFSGGGGTSAVPMGAVNTGSGILFASPYGASAAGYSTVAGGASGGMGAGSILGGLGAIGSGALSYGTSFVGGTLMQLGATNAGYGLFSSGAGGSAAGFNAGATYGPYALAGIGGYYGGQYFSQNILGQHGKYSGLGGSLGAMGGMAVGGSSTMMTAMGMGSFAGPVGMIAGAVLGTLLGSAIGGIGPDKYKHAGTRTTNLGDFLGRYEGTSASKTPEGVLAMQGLLEEMSSTIDDLPEWMGGRYEADITSTIDAIKDFDVTFWVNRNREATGNMAKSVGELEKAFSTGYDNMDSKSQEAFLKMLNITESELPEALKKGLDAYSQEVAAYYEQLSQRAADIFTQAIGAGLQSSTLTSASQAFSNTLASQLSQAVATALTEKLTSTTLYEKLMGTFLENMDIAIEGASSKTYDYMGAVSDYSKTLGTSRNPIYDPEIIRKLMIRLNEDLGMSTDPFKNMSSGQLLSLVAGDVNINNAGWNKFLSPAIIGYGSTEQEAFLKLPPSMQEQYMRQNYNSSLDKYLIEGFDPEAFEKNMELYISEFKSQLPQTVKMFQQVFSVYDELDKQINAEQYAKNIDLLLGTEETIGEIGRYIRELDGTFTEVDRKTAEINNQFDAWVELLTKYGASESQLAGLLEGGALREKALSTIDETMTGEITANFAQAIATSFSQSTKSAGYKTFLNSIKSGLYENILSSITQAFVASTAYQNALKPVTEAIQNAFDSAMSEGSFNTSLYQSLITPAMASLSQVLSTLEPMFSSAYDLMASVGSQLITDTIEQTAEETISQYASNIGEAFTQASSQEGFSLFMTNVKQGMFDAVSQGIINAFLTSEVYKSVMSPLTNAINEAFTQAMSSGEFNVQLFKSLIQPSLSILDGTLESLEPLFESVYDLISYVGSKTIKTSNLVGGSVVSAYADGGLTNGISIAGEKGREWIVPTYEPERSRFLKDIGMDSLGEYLSSKAMKYEESPVGRNYQTLANVVSTAVQQAPRFTREDLQEIGRVIAQSIRMPESATGEIHVHFYLDGQDITNRVAYDLEVRGNSRLEEAIAKVRPN